MTAIHLHNLQQTLKWLAFGLGMVSIIAVIGNWHPYTMWVGLPFCMIWCFHGWMNHERQLFLTNLSFSGFYLLGIIGYYV